MSSITLEVKANYSELQKALKESEKIATIAAKKINKELGEIKIPEAVVKNLNAFIGSFAQLRQLTSGGDLKHIANEFKNISSEIMFANEKIKALGQATSALTRLSEETKKSVSEMLNLKNATNESKGAMAGYTIKNILDTTNAVNVLLEFFKKATFTAKDFGITLKTLAMPLAVSLGIDILVSAMGALYKSANAGQEALEKLREKYKGLSVDAKLAGKAIKETNEVLAFRQKIEWQSELKDTEKAFKAADTNLRSLEKKILNANSTYDGYNGISAYKVPNAIGSEALQGIAQFKKEAEQGAADIGKYINLFEDLKEQGLVFNFDSNALQLFDDYKSSALVLSDLTDKIDNSGKKVLENVQTALEMSGAEYLKWSEVLNAQQLGALREAEGAFASDSSRISEYYTREIEKIKSALNELKGHSKELIANNNEKYIKLEEDLKTNLLKVEEAKQRELLNLEKEFATNKMTISGGLLSQEAQARDEYLSGYEEAYKKTALNTKQTMVQSALATSEDTITALDSIISKLATVEIAGFKVGKAFLSFLNIKIPNPIDFIKKGIKSFLTKPANEEDLKTKLDENNDPKVCFNGGGGGVSKEIKDPVKEAEEAYKKLYDQKRMILDFDQQYASIMGNNVEAEILSVEQRSMAWHELAKEIEDAGEKQRIFSQITEMTERALETASGKGIYGFKHALIDIKEEATDTYKQMYDVTKMAFTGIEDSMVGLMMQSGNFKETIANMAHNVAEAIYRMAVNIMLIEPLVSWVQGLFGFTSGSAGGKTATGILGKSLDLFSGLLPSAKGNVFQTKGLSAYSNKVVNSPTVFPFATGIGLMGEAGPEAIMPLKRGSDGSLGVAAYGSGGRNDYEDNSSQNANLVQNLTINIEKNNTSSNSENDEELARRIAVNVEKSLRNFVENTLVDNMRPGGILNRNFR